MVGEKQFQWISLFKWKKNRSFLENCEKFALWKLSTWRWLQTNFFLLKNGLKLSEDIIAVNASKPDRILNQEYLRANRQFWRIYSNLVGPFRFYLYNSVRTFQHFRYLISPYSKSLSKISFRIRLGRGAFNYFLDHVNFKKNKKLILLFIPMELCHFEEGISLFLSFSLLYTFCFDYSCSLAAYWYFILRNCEDWSEFFCDFLIAWFYSFRHI